MCPKKSFLILGMVFVLLFVGLVSAEGDADENGYTGKLTLTNTGGGMITITGPGQPPAHYCGNGILETYIGEQCDGSTVLDCSAVDSSWEGELSCSEDCNYDTSACSVVVSDDGGDGGSSSSGSNGNGGSSSSSSTNINTCIEDWSCSEWSECEGNLKTRTCEDSNDCGTEKIKPIEEVGCGSIDIGAGDDPEPRKFFSGVTGAVVGAVGSTGGAVVSVFVLVALGGLIAIRIKKRRAGNEKKVMLKK
jgi:hypothetical protein